MSGFVKAFVVTWIVSTVLWATNGKLGGQLVSDVWYLAIALLFIGGFVGMVGSRGLRESHGAWSARLIVLGFVATLGGPLTVRFLQGL